MAFALLGNPVAYVSASNEKEDKTNPSGDFLPSFE